MKKNRVKLFEEFINEQDEYSRTKKDLRHNRVYDIEMTDDNGESVDILVYEDEMYGVNWYAVKGSKTINATTDEIIEFENIYDLKDIDVISTTSPIKDFTRFRNLIEDFLIDESMNEELKSSGKKKLNKHELNNITEGLYDILNEFDKSSHKYRYKNIKIENDGINKFYINYITQEADDYQGFQLLLDFLSQSIRSDLNLNGEPIYNSWKEYNIELYLYFVIRDNAQEWNIKSSRDLSKYFIKLNVL